MTFTKNYKEEVLIDKPVSYWRMDSTSELKDQTATKNEGVLNGLIPTAEGALINSGDVDQSNSFSNLATNFWQIPETPTLNLTTALTVEAWVYPEQINGGIFEKIIGGVENTAYKILMESSDGKLTGHVTKAGLKTLKSTALVPQNTWTHCVMTYDNVTLRVFVNGVESGSGPVAGPIESGEGISLIGKVLNGNPFKGRIDEVAIYKTTLEPARILAHFEAGTKPLGAPPSGVIHGGKTSALYTTIGVEVEESTTPLIAENLQRNGIQISNASATQTMYLKLASTAETKKGITLAPGGVWNGFVGPMVWTGPVSAIATAAKTLATVTEV